MCCFTSNAAEVRTWTNKDGAVIKGELVGAREKELDLKLQDNHVVSIPRHIISNEDEQYVLKWAQEKGFDAAGKPGQNNTPPAGNTAKTIRVWPPEAGPGIVLVTKVKEEGVSNIYQSEHFVYESVIPLLPEEIAALSKEMETCFTVLSVLPVDFPLVSNPRRKYQVKVYFEESWYLGDGGTKGQQFTAVNASIMVMLERTAKGKPEQLGSLNGMHETAHWFTQYAGRDFWFNEGLAVYMELLPRAKDKVIFDGDIAKVARKVPRIYRSGWERLPSVKSILESDPADKSERMQAGKLIVSTYFLKFDGGGTGDRINNYIKAIQGGEKDTAKLDSILLSDRSWQQLEEDIKQSFKGKMKLLFEESK